MENYIIIGIILIVVGLAVAYIIKAKKNGKKCIGCPHGASCTGKKDGESCSCCGYIKSEEKSE